MTDRVDPKYDDRQLLSLAIDRASEIVTGDAAIADQADFDSFVERLTSGEVPAEQLLAHAFLGAMDRLRIAYEVRPISELKYRCGWCWSASGGSADAWSALPQLGDAEMKAHTLVCEHNPLARAARTWADAHDAVAIAGPLSTDDEECALASAQVALRKLVIP